MGKTSMSKKILVTGAGGYIGRYVVKSLLDLGYGVIASDFNYDDVDERADRSDAEIFSGDKTIFRNIGSPDILIHLAWRNGFLHNDESHMSDLSAHFVFLNNMLNGGLSHLAVMGSMHEIGYYEGEIDENTPANPLSLYGVAKNTLRCAFKNILSGKDDITFQWLRAYYIYGDDLRNNSIFSKLMQKEAQGAEFFPFTTGKNKYDFISVEELGKQIALASTQSDVTGEINCCSGKPISLAEKVEEFLKERNMKIKLQYGAFPDREYDSPAVWGNNAKIEMVVNNFLSCEGVK